MTSRVHLSADVTIAISYRDDEYDVDAIVADIIRTHGRVQLADLNSHDVAAVVARHTR